MVMCLSHEHWTIGRQSNPWGRIFSIVDVLNDHRGYRVRVHKLWCLRLNDWDSYGKKQDTGSCDNTEQSFPDSFRFPARQGREECATNLLGRGNRVRPPIPQVFSEREAYMSEIIKPVVDL